jgi:hypothetical protein
VSFLLRLIKVKVRMPVPLQCGPCCSGMRKRRSPQGGV